MSLNTGMEKDKSGMACLFWIKGQMLKMIFIKNSELTIILHLCIICGMKVNKKEIIENLILQNQGFLGGNR